jgi:hypothetical protein
MQAKYIDLVIKKTGAHIKESQRFILKKEENSQENNSNE